MDIGYSCRWIGECSKVSPTTTCAWALVTLTMNVWNTAVYFKRSKWKESRVISKPDKSTIQMYISTFITFHKLFMDGMLKNAQEISSIAYFMLWCVSDRKLHKIAELDSTARHARRSTNRAAKRGLIYPWWFFAGNLTPQRISTQPQVLDACAWSKWWLKIQQTSEKQSVQTFGENPFLCHSIFTSRTWWSFHVKRMFWNDWKVPHMLIKSYNKETITSQ